MKKLFLLALTALCAFAPLHKASAQTNTTTISTNSTSNISVLPGSLGAIWDSISASGVLNATNFGVVPYLTYAPSAKDTIGGGVLVAYNLNDYAAAGIEADYLGQFSLVSANMTLKLPMHPFAHLTWFNGALQPVEVTPFALVGVGKSFASGAEGAIAVTDAGAFVKFGHLWKGRFVAGGCYGRWDNAGPWSGPRAHVFAGWTANF